MEYRRCCVCKQELELNTDTFEKYRTGWRSECRQCRRNANAVYRQTAMYKLSHCRNQKLARINDPVNAALIRARGRAKSRGIPFTITRRDVHIPKVCPVLGIPMVVAEGKWQDGSATLDRIDPRLGYVPGNVCVISYRANRLKSDATADELEALAAYARDTKKVVYTLRVGK